MDYQNLMREDIILHGKLRNYCLFIKITLIAPAKRSVIINLKKSDMNENYKRMHINNVNINVPNGLTRDYTYIY